METFEKVKNLLAQANEIEGAFNKMAEYAKRPQHYDKTGFGFNADNRFAACEGLTLRVDSWMGTYGDSGCGRILSLDKSIFNKHLMKVLSAEFEPIMRKVAESIRKEAGTLKEQAISELEKQKEQLSGV